MPLPMPNLALLGLTDTRLKALIDGNAELRQELLIIKADLMTLALLHPGEVRHEGVCPGLCALLAKMLLDAIDVPSEEVPCATDSPDAPTDASPTS